MAGESSRPQTLCDVLKSFVGLGQQNDLDRGIGIITGFFFGSIVIGVIALILFVDPCKNGVVAVGYGLLLAGGTVGSAFLVGFLFGMPRVVAEQQERRNAHSGAVRASANLEQISDWLTKIIVGIGIAEFPSVLTKTKDIFNYIDATHILGKGSPSLGVIFYFAPPGFLLGYFYARTFFTRLFGEVNGLAGDNSSSH